MSFVAEVECEFRFQKCQKDNGQLSKIWVLFVFFLKPNHTQNATRGKGKIAGKGNVVAEKLLLFLSVEPKEKKIVEIQEDCWCCRGCEEKIRPKNEKCNRK